MRSLKAALALSLVLVAVAVAVVSLAYGPGTSARRGLAQRSTPLLTPERSVK